MPSKQVTDRRKSSDSVVEAANVHAERVATAAEAILTPYLVAGEAMPDIKLLMLLAGRCLSARSAKMVEADEAHIHELSDDAPARDRRDRAHEGLNDAVVGMREAMIGLFGQRQTEALGFATETPRDAAALVSFSKTVSKSLRDKTFPAPARMKVTWSPKAEADEIDVLRKELDEALSGVAREVKEAEATLVDKNTAIEGYDEAFSGVARLLQGIFVFAGESELANRVRPSARRPGQTEELAPQAGSKDSEEGAPEK